MSGLPSSTPESGPARADSVAQPFGTKRFATSGAGVLAALLLGGLAFFYSQTPLWHTDIWGHLRFGAWIAEHARLPATEPFCDFADKETPLIHFAWGSQLLFLAFFRAGEWLAGGDEMQRLAGGVAALRSLTVLLALLFAWQMLLAYRNLSRSLSLAVLGFLLYLLFSPTTLAVLRPQLFGMVLFAFLLARLSRDDWNWREVVVGALTFLFWVNLHGSFVVGLGLLAAFAAGRFLSRCWADGQFVPRSAVRDGEFRRLAATLGLGVLATFLNPHGPAIYRAVLGFANHPVTRLFDEFQPLDLQLGPGALFRYVASVVILLVSWLAGRRWLGWTAVLVVLVFGLAPIGQRRLAMWWLPLVPWLAVPAWKALAERRQWNGLTTAGVSKSWYALVGGVALFLGLFWIPGVQSLFSGPAPLAQAVTPVTPWKLARQLNGHEQTLPRLAATLKRNYPDGELTGRIFASETLGEFLLWETPNYPVVAYAHSHVFSLEHWTGVMAVKNGEPGFEAWLDKWNVNLIVVEAQGHPRLRDRIRQDTRWQVVHDDAGDPTAARSPANWLFVAVRKEPR